MPTASTLDSAPGDLLRAHRVECIAALTAGTAHHLNNHLASLVMLLDTLEPDLPARQAATASWLRESIARSIQSLRQMEWLARSVPSEPVLYQPLYVVKDVVNLLREGFSPEIAIAADDPEETCLVDGDPALLQQVLLAMSLDAVHGLQGLDEGGEIVLRPRSEPASDDAEFDLRVDVESRPLRSAGPPGGSDATEALLAALAAAGGRISAPQSAEGWRRVRLELPGARTPAIRAATEALADRGPL